MIINKGRFNKYYVKDNKNLFFYPQQWLKLIDLANEKQRFSFIVLLHTGARVNEARHIKFEDIDTVRNNLILKITKVRAKRGEKKPTPRHIPISNILTKEIKKIMAKKGLISTDYLPMLKPSALNYAIKQLSKKAGINNYLDLSVHNIRKTTETWLVALGIDALKIAKHLGHTPAVAFNNYLSADIFNYDDKRLIRQILGDLYSYQERHF